MNLTHRSGLMAPIMNLVLDLASGAAMGLVYGKAAKEATRHA